MNWYIECGTYNVIENDIDQNEVEHLIIGLMSYKKNQKKQNSNDKTILKSGEEFSAETLSQFLHLLRQSSVRKEEARRYKD